MNLNVFLYDCTCPKGFDDVQRSNLYVVVKLVACLPRYSHNEAMHEFINASQNLSCSSMLGYLGYGQCVCIAVW